MIVQAKSGLIEPRPFHMCFGTGGIRALMGEGPNRLNPSTVARATQGFADWLNSKSRCGCGLSVVIACDCRNQSEKFVDTACAVLLGNGIDVFDLGVQPTPMLSFAVRHLDCDAGLVITASHNTKEWNGYKVYGKDGCQATTTMCREIAQAIHEVKLIRVEYENSRKTAPDVEQLYAQALAAAAPKGQSKGMRIAYSSLNGTGWKLVPSVLRGDGAWVTIVPEQAMLDGAFPTCPSPNPEHGEAMQMVSELALRENCDLALATDPDADRVGVLVRHNGSMVRLSGDEVGALLLDWMCRTCEEAGENVAGRIVVSTVATSTSLDAICRHWGIELRRTLTGFQVCRRTGELARGAGTKVAGFCGQGNRIS